MCTCHWCFYSKKNIPVFHLTYQRKDLAVRVTVDNMNGDDAYEAKLLTTFPQTLSYSGVRSNPAPVRQRRPRVDTSAHYIRMALIFCLICFCFLLLFGSMILSMEVSSKRNKKREKCHLHQRSGLIWVIFVDF